jgi:vanillate O-demethylase monooxygenase subunit
VYLPTDQTHFSEIPRGCTFAESDWRILAGFWHPVAFGTEVEDKPVRAKLLDVDLVVYRTVDGVGVAKDVCVHRGAALSLGWMDDECKNLVCPMHGLHYDHTGQCTRIPSLADQSKRISRKLRLMSYQAVERYGLVWVCLNQGAIRPMPEWPLLDNAGTEWQTITLPKGFWRASASRHCENFNDVAHLSWVHTTTFGNRDRPEIPNYTLERTDAGMFMQIPYTEVERMFFDADEDASEREVVYSYDLTYPFATDHTVEHTTTDGFRQLSHIYDIASPASACETAIFQFVQTNIPDATADDYVEYQSKVNHEDIPLVESQRPEEVPLNAAAELHIPADKFSIQYRRDLVRLFGLGASPLTA